MWLALPKCSTGRRGPSGWLSAGHWHALPLCRGSDMRRGTHCQPLALMAHTRQPPLVECGLTVADYCVQAEAGTSSSGSPGQQPEAVRLQAESHPQDTGGRFSYWWESPTISPVTLTGREGEQGGPSQTCAHASHHTVRFAAGMKQGDSFVPCMAACIAVSSTAGREFQAPSRGSISGHRPSLLSDLGSAGRVLHGTKLDPEGCVLPADAAAGTEAASSSHQGAAAKPAEARARGHAGMRTMTAAEWLFILRPLLYVLMLKK